MSEKTLAPSGDSCELKYLENDQGRRVQHLVISKGAEVLSTVEMSLEDSFYISEELMLSLSDMQKYDQQRGHEDKVFNARMAGLKLKVLQEWFEPSMQNVAGNAYQLGFIKGLAVEDATHKIELIAGTQGARSDAKLEQERAMGSVIHQLAEACTTSSQVTRETILGRREVQQAIRKSVT